MKRVNLFDIVIYAEETSFMQRVDLIEVLLYTAAELIQVFLYIE